MPVASRTGTIRWVSRWWTTVRVEVASAAACADTATSFRYVVKCNPDNRVAHYDIPGRGRGPRGDRSSGAARADRLRPPGARGAAADAAGAAVRGLLDAELDRRRRRLPQRRPGRALPAGQVHGEPAGGRPGTAWAGDPGERSRAWPGAHRDPGRAGAAAGGRGDPAGRAGPPGGRVERCGAGRVRRGPAALQRRRAGLSRRGQPVERGWVGLVGSPRVGGFCGGASVDSAAGEPASGAGACSGCAASGEPPDGWAPAFRSPSRWFIAWTTCTRLAWDCS